MRSRSKVQETYEIFKDYFGESKVDLQDTSTSTPFILIWWPQVKVTNENNRSIWIQDLYAKVQITRGGLIPTFNRGFTLNRATYPLDQWVCSYMHSHISQIPKGNLTRFMEPCLGRGPINNTIISLKEETSHGYDTTLWMLFCEELSRYVTVESLTGVPYNYLENVSLNDRSCYYKGFDTLHHKDALGEYIRVVGNNLFLPDFIKYYLHHGHLVISFQQGSFICGMSYRDYMIDISNAFIEYFNSHVTDESLSHKFFNSSRYSSCNNILNRVKVSGDKFYELNSTRELPDVSIYQGHKVCDFKGQEIKLRIFDNSRHETPQTTTLLNHGLAMFILNNLLKTINYHYRNEYNNPTTLPATSCQRAYYL